MEGAALSAAKKRPLSAEEARAAAAADGLELLTSDNATGFKSVVFQGGMYMARVNGRKKQLFGPFATPEEAALAYTRHVGADQEATKGAAAKRKRPQPLSAEEAKAAAIADGLELVTAGNAAGFRNVCLLDGRYVTLLPGKWGRKSRSVGGFVTPEEAALAYARHVGAKQAAIEAAAARGVGPQQPQPLTAEQARAAAAAEGLELVTSRNESGLKGVSLTRHGKYNAHVWDGSRLHSLGSFATPDEAALVYARHIGVDKSAVEAKAARDELTAMAADEASLAAAADILRVMS